MSKSKSQDKQYHYVYKSSLKDSNLFYIGRHSTDEEDRVNDGYFGSGRWITSIKDKSRLSKVILESYDNFDELRIGEEKYILEHIDDPNCMNFLRSSSGFAPGEHHPQYGITGELSHWYGRKHSEETKQKQSIAKKGVHVGENNPFYGKTHTEEIKHKISDKNKGRKHSEKHRQKNSEAHTGDKNPNTKLKEPQVLEIIRKLGKNLPLLGGLSRRKR